MTIEKFYPEVNFGGFTRTDGTIAFYQRVNALINSDFTILDYGCGRGSFIEDENEYRRNLRKLKGKCKNVIGVDVDPVGFLNPTIDNFYQLNGYQIPLETDSIDLCVCDWVLEHIEHPHELFQEFKRVIKPGGFLCIRTVNKWHYVSITSLVIPEKLHQKILQIAQPTRAIKDVFPTFYRCNSKNDIDNMFRKFGKDYSSYYFEAEPAYLNFSNTLFGLDVFFQRNIPFGRGLSLFGFCRF